MARGTNLLLKNIRGALGKEIVIKQYKNRTVITAYPEQRKKKPTALKKVYEGRFAEAVKYAQGIIHNPEKKKLYEKKGQRGKKKQGAYHYAISEYLRKTKVR